MEISAAPRNPWIRRFHTTADRPARLVCFPHAGGTASFYIPFSRALSADVDVLAVQYPGRHERRAEQPATDILTMARAAADALDVWSDVPLVLFGHSMGATIAHEAARILEHEGRARVARLIVSGRTAPSRRHAKPADLREEAAVLKELQAMSGTDDRLLREADLLAVIMPIIRADYAAIAAHTPAPEPLLRADITAFLGRTDGAVSEADAEAWQRHTTGRFDLRLFPGGHFYLREAPRAVVRAISEVLRTVTTGG